MEEAIDRRSGGGDSVATTLHAPGAEALDEGLGRQGIGDDDINVVERAQERDGPGD